MSPPARLLKAARAVCDHCRRPVSVCYCAHLPVLETRTRVLVLQHPREQHMAIGTARMAHLSLPNSVLRVGLDFSTDAVVASELAAASASYVLFPGAQALDVRQLPRGAPVTLVVLDGTWSQAGKLLRLNPALAALPRVAFTPARPSDYRIRRQPAEFCVSTIEALAEVLGVLEPDRGPFERLLDPFRAMVARQEWFQTEIESGRHRDFRSRRAQRPARPSLAARLVADWPNLVCVQGEANGWPVHAPVRHDSETVQFVACRPATGEVYQQLVAPRHLAPSTASHIGVPAERLLAGATIDEWHRSWQAFVRPDDVLVQWGVFHVRLAAAEGLPLPVKRVELRAEIVRSLGHRVGTLEACTQRFGASETPLGVEGRGGRRLAALVGLLRVLCAQQ